MSKQNNTATKTLLEAEEMAKALKESTKKSLSEMVKTAISQMILESEDEDEKETDATEPAKKDTETFAPDTQEDNDDYDEEDVETDDDSTDADSEESSEDTEESSEDTEDEDWSDMEDYKVGDNEYDLTSLDNEEALKVYNKLGDDDYIHVKKVDDTSYEIEDEETGAEYVIDIDVDAMANADDNIEDVDGEDEEAYLENSDDDDEPEDELDIEIEDEPEDESEDELDIDVVDDDEDILNETELCYTNDYQNDVMPGLNMNEPANSNATYSMDAGVPKGNKRPYSGYKKKAGDPFIQEEIEECGLMTDESELEEATNVGGAVHQRSSSKSNIPSGRKNYGPKTKRHVSAAGEYSEAVNEELKAIKEDNAKYRNYIGTIKKNLYEAFVTNVKLGNILKLVCENSTTPDEKQNIVKRFNEAKTIKESKMLYETIKNELKATAKSAPILEHQLSVGPKKTLNETTIFASNPVLDLMHRMDNMDKMWKK